MKTILLLLLFVTVGCFAAPKPIAHKIRLHKSKKCDELSTLEDVMVEELAILSLGKRESSGSITPVMPISPTGSSPACTQPPTPGTSTVKRARSTQPGDSKQS